MYNKIRTWTIFSRIRDTDLYNFCFIIINNKIMLQRLFNPNSDHLYGNPLACVELIQYGDLQSRRCALAYPEIKFLQDMMGNQLKFVFRHFPVQAIHPLALEAAIATEAAAIQGKFWHMHDMIFENQTWLTKKMLKDFAQSIDLDVCRYEKDGENKCLLEKITGDMEGGVKSGVLKAPTFFINGLAYTGSVEFESLFKTCSQFLHLHGMQAPLTDNAAGINHYPRIFTGAASPYF